MKEGKRKPITVFYRKGNSPGDLKNKTICYRKALEKMYNFIWNVPLKSITWQEKQKVMSEKLLKVVAPIYFSGKFPKNTGNGNLARSILLYWVLSALKIIVEISRDSYKDVLHHKAN